MATQRAHGIGWCDETWNPIRGCSPVGAGCDHCWAARIAARFSGTNRSDPDGPAGANIGLQYPYYGFAETCGGNPRWTGRVELIACELERPLRWRKPRRIAVGLMGDWMHPGLADKARDRILAVEALCPQHTFLHLTKRWERQAQYLTSHATLGRFAQLVAELTDGLKGVSVGYKYVADGMMGIRLPNVITGVSAWDQASADEACWWLAQTPAACRLLCLEPLLGPVDLARWLQCQRRLDECHARGLFPCCDPLGGHHCSTTGPWWVIVGGETGPGARPCNVQWIRSVVRQCRDAGVPVYVKQLGSYPVVEACRQHHYDFGGEIGRKARFSAVDPLYPSAGLWRVHLTGKGSDPSEWPLDLRVRELSGVRNRRRRRRCNNDEAN